VPNPDENQVVVCVLLGESVNTKNIFAIISLKG
jgi:hypothetical protein